jgi:putative flippase GtrA
MNANDLRPSLRTARYYAVVCSGFGLDFGIALALSRLAGFCLEFSAAIGFLGALALNYMLFEFWVFRGEHSAFSAARLSQTALAAGAALSVRVSIIWLVGKFLGKTLPEVAGTILLGAGASVLVNYLLLRLIFTHHRSGHVVWLA